jgi:seryl-tRNA synthetase
MIKYFDSKTKTNKFVHTLNGTGTSLNRLFVAIIENCQNKNGSITIPTALQKYMNGQKVISCPVVKKIAPVKKVSKKNK